MIRLDRNAEEELPLDLPAFEEHDDTSGSEVTGLGLDGDDDFDQALGADDGADPFDDAAAENIPLDIDAWLSDARAGDETSAIGDDATGLDGAVDDGVDLGDEGGPTMLGADEDGLEREEAGDDEVFAEASGGGDYDDGGIEGPDDPAADRIEESELPPLDGQERDDDIPELDLGLSLEL